MERGLELLGFGNDAHKRVGTAYVEAGGAEGELEGVSIVSGSGFLSESLCRFSGPRQGLEDTFVKLPNPDQV